MLGPLVAKTYLLPSLDSATEMKRSTPEESAWLTLEEPLDEDPLEEELLEEIDFKLSGNEPLLSVEETKNEQAAVIYTKFYDDAAENHHFSAIVRKMVKNYTPFG